MRVSTFEAVAGALNRAGVRYLVAGGLAVNAHGYVRLTQDIDLAVQLDAGNIVPAFSALASLGYRPIVPVTAAQFADPAQRDSWAREKGMVVLNFHSELHRSATVDVFVSLPFDFAKEYEAAMRAELSPDLVVRFVSLETLIAMKRLANRPRDLDDIEHLRVIAEERGKT